MSVPNRPLFQHLLNLPFHCCQRGNAPSSCSLRRCCCSAAGWGPPRSRSSSWGVWQGHLLSRGTPCSVRRGAPWRTGRAQTWLLCLVLLGLLSPVSRLGAPEHPHPEGSGRESDNPRTIWTGRGLKVHLLPPPCQGQGHFPLDQVSPSPVQSGLQRKDAHELRALR